MVDKGLIEASLRNRFAFLRDKGFQFDSFKYYEKSFGDWRITFKSQKCIMEVYRERYGDINIMFKSTTDSIQDKWFGIQTLIYFISDRKNFLGLFEGKWSDMDGQINRYVNILNVYIDDILALFENGFAQKSQAIEEMGKPLFDLIMAEYKKREQTLATSGKTADRKENKQHSVFE